MSSPAPHAPRVPHVPYTGGEKESLHTSLDRHRDIVLWKLEGLDDEQLRRPMTPTGTNLLGLVKHLATVEYGWFCAAFGRPTETFWFDTATEDMTVGPNETTADILAFYARARTAADAAIRETDLETTGTAWDGRVVSMRWVLIHMLEDLLRHAGHMDIVRELIDGATGSYPAPA
ncbi:DinB family protein [Streptomyces parvus]|uniref:DinB family protein n=1 Tax=Streptomyces parvus TaxID=66428 RepID=UPI003632563B